MTEILDPALTPSDAYWLETAEKSLRRWVRQQNRWFAEVDRRIAGEEPSKMRVPSKAGKYRAYDSARVIERLRGLATRCENFPMLCALVGEPCNARLLSEYVLQEDGIYRHRSTVKA